MQRFGYYSVLLAMVVLSTLPGCNKAASSLTAGRGGGSGNLSGEMGKRGSLLIPESRYLTPEEIGNFRLDTRFQNKGDKSVLVYIANDSPEKLMQLAVKFELKTLIDICLKNRNANWIAYIGSQLSQSAEASQTKTLSTHICINGSYSQVEVDNFVTHKDFLQPPTDQAILLAGYKLKHDMLKLYPFVEPQNISNAFRQALRYFEPKSHQFYVMIKSHGARDLPILAIDEKTIADKNETAGKLFSALLGRDADVVHSLGASGSFDPQMIEANRGVFEKLHLGDINLSSAQHTVYWQGVQQILFPSKSGSTDSKSSSSTASDLLTIKPPQVDSQDKSGKDKNEVPSVPDDQCKNFVNNSNSRQNSTNPVLAPGDPNNTQGAGHVTQGGDDRTLGSGCWNDTLGGKGYYAISGIELRNLLLIETLTADKKRVNPDIKIRAVSLDACRNEMTTSIINARTELAKQAPTETAWAADGAMWYRSVDYQYIFDGTQSNDEFNAKFLRALSEVQFAKHVE